MDDVRFEFGQNWRRYLDEVTEQRLATARESIATSLAELKGSRFLDIGSGSGVFSLAARELGASVVSFDYDPESVECVRSLRARFRPEDDGWSIRRGSVLDPQFMASLGQFDVVYSWGVLHHTGSMWEAIDAAADAVAPKGRLFISIYNDQGWISRTWWIVKRLYVGLPRPLKWIVLFPTFLLLWGPSFLMGALRGRPLEKWKNYGAQRGMSPWVDVVDWVGGFPFEVASPEEIISHLTARGFHLVECRRVGRRLGCNEFVFLRDRVAAR